MKIQSIANFGLSKQQTNGTPKHANNIAFEGKLNLQTMQKFPLEKKLTHMFASCKPGDVIAVGKSFAEIQSGIAKSIDKFSNVIKRVFFVKHGGLAVPLAFAPAINLDSAWACTNIGDKKVLLSTSEIVEDIEPTDCVGIDEGDVIINNKVNIPIGISPDYAEDAEDLNDVVLLTNPGNFAAKVIDLSDIQQLKIAEVNADTVASLETENVNLKSEGKKDGKLHNLSFKDVGGLDSVIEKLEDAILFPIKFDYAYKEDGVEVNKGVLLHGKPGTGKTLIAEALANECNANFVKICGTDLESKWVGDTEGMWRKLFKDAIEKQPSIIFVDEIDAVTKERGEGVNNQHNDKVVTQILTLMGDLEKSDDKVFVIATTNKPKTMDSAILRSGRFGEIIEVTEPNREGKKSILNIHTRKKRIDPNLDIEKLLDEFDKRGFTGADIKHITNKAHTISWNRQGIRQKMKDGTLTRQDMLGTNINFEDFEKALADWDNTQVSRNKRNPIGF